MNSAEKPRRKQIQIYVPRHRRIATTPDESPENSSRLFSAPFRSASSGQQEEVVRRGRGQFRAPSGTVSPVVREPSPSPPPLPATSSTPSTAADGSATSAMEEAFAAAMENLSLERSSPSSSKDDWEDLLADDDSEEEEKQISRGTSPRTATAAATGKTGDSIEQLTTILECSGFPASFKTQHIYDIFRIYEDMAGGFKLKWMDDTRVLVLFDSAATAKKAYIENIDNPQAKITPYTGAVEFITSVEGAPIPQRPVTTDVVARRLVHGALGMRGPTRTAEQRQAERTMLQAAREQREAKKQQAARSEQANSDAFYDQ